MTADGSLGLDRASDSRDTVQIPEIRSNPVLSTKTNCERFFSPRVKNVVLARCRKTFSAKTFPGSGDRGVVVDSLCSEFTSRCGVWDGIRGIFAQLCLASDLDSSRRCVKEMGADWFFTPSEPFRR